MIRGKKIRKPLRRLKIQEEADPALTPDFVDDGEEIVGEEIEKAVRTFTRRTAIEVA